MSPQLKALLVSMAVFVAGGVAYYVPKVTTSNAELVAAGVRTDCNIRKAACTFLESLDGGAPEYDEREFYMAQCPSIDGGRPERIIPRALARAARDIGLHDLQGQCRDLGAAAAINFNGGAPSHRDFSCVYRQRDAGPCRHLDGGSLAVGEVAQPGEFLPAGAGCVGTPCTTVFGYEPQRER